MIVSRTIAAFRDPKDLQRFLCIFEGSHIDNARRHLQMRLGDNIPAEIWTTHLPEGSTYSDARSAEQRIPSLNVSDSLRAKGHFRLHLLHAAWNGAGKGNFTKYTAHTLSYLVHILAIM
jgi:hypothetical protein